MAFATALKHAQDLGGQSVIFTQPESWCTALVARWLKYRMLGKDFWGNPRPARAIQTEATMNLTLATGAMRTKRIQLTADGKTKYSGLYSRFRAEDKDGGEWIIEYLGDTDRAGQTREAVRNKPSKFRLRYQASGEKAIKGGFDDNALVSAVLSSAADYFHLSLHAGVDASTSSGTFQQNPLSSAGGGQPHSIGIARTRTEVALFDPNMGEVKVPSSASRTGGPSSALNGSCPGPTSTISTSCSRRCSFTT